MRGMSSDDSVKGLDRAIRVMGGASALAAALAEKPQVVSNWKARGVPADRCPDIERVTRDKGDRVPCEEMRPDIDWAVLRSAA